MSRRRSEVSGPAPITRFCTRPHVKVCGFTDPRQAVEVAEAGVDWLGLNFFPGSKRYVSADVVRQIVASLPDPGCAVALTVNLDPTEVIQQCRLAGIGRIQLHGDEPPGDLPPLKEAGLKVVRAFRIGDESDLDEARAWLESAASLGASPDQVLVDAKVVGQAGGTGCRIPVTVLERMAIAGNGLALSCGLDLKAVPVIVAGGLTARNVAEVVYRFNPWMVDVASGVERSAGWKDLGMVLEFLNAVRRGTLARELDRCAGPLQDDAFRQFVAARPGQRMALNDHCQVRLEEGQGVVSVEIWFGEGCSEETAPVRICCS